MAYDITDAARLARMRGFLKGFSTGGQKSVFECFLTDGELQMVLDGIWRIVNEDTDRVHVFSLDGRSRAHTLGIGVQPRDPSFFYFG